MKKIIPIGLAFCFCYVAGFSQTDLIRRGIKMVNPDLTESDLTEIKITSRYTDSKNNVEHIYGNQQLGGLDIYEAVFDAHFLNGEFLTAHQSFIVNAASILRKQLSTIDAVQALEKAFEFAGIKIHNGFGKYLFTEVSDIKSELIIPELSTEPIKFRKVYFYEADQLQLGWLINLYPLKGDHWWNLIISAYDGSVLLVEDWVLQCHPASLHNDCDYKPVPQIEMLKGQKAMQNSYNVFPIPTESPNHGNRSVKENPRDSVASPFGWHDTNGSKGAEYNITRGNNVYARDDKDANNTGGTSPDGGIDLIFDAPFDISQSASLYLDAAIINLFYMNNTMHDVWYHYGYNEVAGNFQNHNYNRGTGTGANDYVNADAQDGLSTNNANFATPPDGQQPRMQMFIWNNTKVFDSDFDNGVISHEYGHGISNRLTGGPANTSCLTNGEQMGEGWSDFFALVMTHQPSDKATDRRGVATYLRNQNNDGTGLRTYPYTTDMSISPYAYNMIKTLAAPHGVGSVWAAMLWDLYWNFIETYGYDSDIYKGNGGNNMVMQLVIDGMKLQPCSPGFVDARDAILLADRINNGGKNQKLIWETFARRGLGYSASQGFSSSRSDGKEGYDIPPLLVNEMQIVKTTNEEQESGSVLNYNVFLSNKTTNVLRNVTFNDTLSDDVAYLNNQGCPIVFSGKVLSFHLDSVKAGQSFNCNYSVKLSANKFSTVFSEDSLEGDVSDWKFIEDVGTIKWKLAQNKKRSGSNSLFVGNPATKSDQSVYREFDLTGIQKPGLSFWHYYNTEFGWDGGVVEIKEAGTAGSWTDTKDFFVKGAYDTVIAANPESNISGRYAFTGLNSSFTKSILDLSSFAGKKVWIRFRFVADAASGGEGWYIDDVHLLKLHYVKNTARVSVGVNDSWHSSVFTLINEGTGSVSVNVINPKAEISIYPNPTDGVIIIGKSQDQTKNTSASIYSNEGKLLETFILTEQETKIDMSNFSPGIYLLKWQSDAGQRIKKVVKY